MNKIETKKLKKVNEKTLIVTVDIGKTTNMGYGRCPDRTEIKPFEFFNNSQGFKKFWNRMVEAQKPITWKKSWSVLNPPDLMENPCNIF